MQQKQANFPSGIETEDYRGCKKWSNRRWAWEFLRRNTEFQKACDAAVSSSDGNGDLKKDVASQFHLKKFKHYSEEYGPKESRPSFVPIFAFWSIPEGKESRKIKLTIVEGQILIRFDIRPAASSKSSLNSQISRAKKILENRLMEFSAKTNSKPEYNFSKKSSPEAKRDWLRMIDLTRSNHSQPEIFLKLNPNTKEEKDKNGKSLHGSRDELRLKFKSAYRTSERIMLGGYLALALKQEKENEK